MARGVAEAGKGGGKHMSTGFAPPRPECEGLRGTTEPLVGR
jgi:hypothetical protein